MKVLRKKTVSQYINEARGLNIDNVLKNIKDHAESMEPLEIFALYFTILEELDRQCIIKGGPNILLEDQHYDERYRVPNNSPCPLLIAGMRNYLLTNFGNLTDNDTRQALYNLSEHLKNKLNALSEH